MSLSLSYVRLSELNATNLQSSAANQAKEQLASARTMSTSSVARNAAYQCAPSVQTGSAYNAMGLSTAARKLDLGVTKIAATNVQENAVSQAISQEAIARSRYGYTEAANTDSQGACNKQTGLAYNALSVAAPQVKVATIDVSKLDAISQQTNVANQANLQKATSITTGFRPDPALNTGWQTAGNVQIASAYNGVNLSI